MKIGYKLSSEERSAPELIRDAVGAERAGFDFVAIADHFHPWLDVQGQSPFVWLSIGAIAQATTRIEVLTAVTCPTMRIHPALVAQAAATAATMLPRRFSLGLGTGENLNEHIVGERWPNATQRRERLAEAVEMIRDLWSGELISRDGRWFRVDTARLYSLPDEPPPVLLAASGGASAQLAGEIGDGMIGLSPDPDLLQRFRAAGGRGKPSYAEITVRYDANGDEEGALEVIRRTWPMPGMAGELSAELPLPRHFEESAQTVRSDDLREKVVVGSDTGPYEKATETFTGAGYDHVWFHHVGTDQDRFLDFARSNLLPALRSRSSR